MKSESLDIPGWTLEIVHAARGIYKLSGTGPHGSIVQRLGTDHGDLLRYANAVAETATQSNVPFKPTTTEFPELPGWIFDANEVSAGVYEEIGVGPNGYFVRHVGTDESRLLQTVREAARQMFRGRGRA